MKNRVKNGSDNGMKALLAVALIVGMSAANAALPTEAAAAFTTITGNVTDIFAAIWPVVAAVVGGFVLIRLFKKGTGAI